MDNSASTELYNLLITRDLEPTALNGKTGQPANLGGDAEGQADMFSFDWKTENQNYGTVVVLLGSDNNMTVFFGDNVGKSMEAGDRSEWYDFLHQLKMFSTRNMLNFEINDINKLKYTMQGMAAIKEGLFEGYYGKKDVSYSDQPKQTRLMIKHNRAIGEGEARYRAIESLFVETSDGSRFKLPHKNLLWGKVTARHCAEGGNPYDSFGQHINKLVTEMNTLARFIRAAKHRTFDEETSKLVEAAIRHYSDIKAKAKRMIGQRGYYEEREKFDPAEFTDSEVTTEAIRDMFIETNIDSRIEEALPILAKLATQTKEPHMKEIKEFEEWTNSVMEGTWALPDTPEAEKQLQQLLSKPLVVGADGTNATEQLYDLVGDDQLFDLIDALADKDPNANLWDDPEVMNRLQELGVDTSSAGASDDEENLDIDMNKHGIDPEGDYDQDKEVDEGVLDTLKSAGKKVVDFVAPDDEELLNRLRKDAGLPPRMAVPNKPKPPQGVGEDLDTDGVMMTKPSNMSS